VNSFSVSDLPGLNAVLNSISGIFLIAGYFFIRSRNIRLHKICMITAFCSSILFLISYLTYHIQTGSKHFPGTGNIRTVYFCILITHTILAATVPPLAILTLIRAWKGKFEKHRRIARWTFPIWLYVSITGVVVYWMLYRL
jgi:putative membrane protein